MISIFKIIQQTFQAILSLFGNILNPTMIEGVVVISVICIVFNFFNNRSKISVSYEDEDDDEYEYVVVRRKK